MHPVLKNAHFECSVVLNASLMVEIEKRNIRYIVVNYMKNGYGAPFNVWICNSEEDYKLHEMNVKQLNHFLDGFKDVPEYSVLKRTGLLEDSSAQAGWLIVECSHQQLASIKQNVSDILRSNGVNF